MGSSTLNVALVQHGAAENYAKSLERARKLASRVPGEVDLIVFPEYSMFDPTGLEASSIKREASRGLEEWIRFYQGLAVEYSAYVVGHIFEPVEGEERVYNTVVVYSPSGEPVSRYSKTHLFDAYGYRESGFTAPGDRLSDVVDLKGFRVGLAICFEIRYPEIFRMHALRGADLVIVPAAWYRGPLKEETLAFLARTRAHENTIYVVVAVNYNRNFTGRSMIIDPYGVVRVDAGIGNHVAVGRLERELLAEARRTLPLLELRRPRLYRDLFSEGDK